MKIVKKILCILILGIWFGSLNVPAVKTPQSWINNGTKNHTDSPNQISQTFSSNGNADIDPLVDLEVTVTIKEIRALDKIDEIGQADFYVVILINNQKFKSDASSRFCWAWVEVARM